jgi:hypothetical protein
MSNKVILIHYSSRLSCGRWRHKIRQQYHEVAGRSRQRKSLPMKVTFRGVRRSRVRSVRSARWFAAFALQPHCARAGGDREARGGLHDAWVEMIARASPTPVGLRYSPARQGWLSYGEALLGCPSWLRTPFGALRPVYAGLRRAGREGLGSGRAGRYFNMREIPLTPLTV